MGKQNEERLRLGPLYLWMLLLRALHDTGSGVADSSQVLPGTSLSRLILPTSNLSYNPSLSRTTIRPYPDCQCAALAGSLLHEITLLSIR